MSQFVMRIKFEAGFHTSAANIEFFEMQRGILKAISAARQTIAAMEYQPNSKKADCTIPFEANSLHHAHVRASEIASLIDQQDGGSLERTFKILSFEVLAESAPN